MLPRVSIIILNWNGWEDTIECLESLYKIDYPNYDVIIVDNASSDNSIAKIKEYCEGKLKIESKFFDYDSLNKPIKVFEYAEKETAHIKHEYDNLPSNNKLIIIKNHENYGFANGNNIAINYALKNLNTDYTFLLNNDTVVNKEFLKKLVEVAESNPNIGIVGPKIYYYDVNGRNDIIWSLGGKVNFHKYPGYHELRNTSNSNACEERDYISGAGMLIKSKSLPIKTLNKEFFFGCEDVDLCIRLKKQGYKMICVLDSHIWHKVSISRKKRNSKVIKKILFDIHNNLKFLKIHNKNYNLYLSLYILQIIKNISLSSLKYVTGL